MTWVAISEQAILWDGCDSFAPLVRHICIFTCQVSDFPGWIAAADVSYIIEPVLNTL